MHRRLSSGTKWVIFATGLILSVAVECKFYSDRKQAERNFHSECHQELRKSAVSVGAQFHALYADLRTIARMPAVRSNRITKQFIADDWGDVRELYASMTESTPIRMVRIVPYFKQWSSEYVDTATLSKDFVSGKGSERLSRYSRQLILLKGQMARMPQNNSGWTWDKLPDYPAYSCRPFLVKFGKATEKSFSDYLFYYSVPIYSENGLLWGCASAELPFPTLSHLLPNLGYSLRNDGDGINVHGLTTLFDPDDVIYTEQMAVPVNDRVGKWKLQISIPSNGFNLRPDMLAAQEFRWAAHLIVAGITIAAFFVFSSLYQRRNELEHAKEFLEHRVSERTTELADALQDAKDASRTKGEFLANMSHEIRTPMNGVIAMTEMLLHTRLNEEQEDLARTIASSAESLMTIINDVLDFSKIEARMLVLEQIDFDLANLLEDVAKLYAPAAAAKGLELVADLQPSTERLVVGDPVRIRQVVSNLLGNAIKFTDQGSVILKAAVTGDGDCLKFSVQDSGMGIPASRIDAIFDSFTQSDASTTRKFGGTGLGLTISRHLAELMGGSIGVQSTLGKGSEFYVSVRIRESLAAGLPVDVPQLDAKRILLCDDFDCSLQVIGRHLIGQKHDVVMSVSGQELVAWLERPDSKPFDVIVIDHSLQDCNVFELVKEIKERNLAPDALMILVSSELTGLSAEDLEKVGISQALVKPVRRDVLFRAVQSERILEPGAAIVSQVVVEAPKEISDPEPAIAQWLNVLLVEDNPVNQKVARKLLANLGCGVTVANDGAEAVDLDLSEFDLVLMDCQMPRLDGLSATRQIRHREQRTGDHAIIVALTANAMEEDRVACLAAGMDDYMAKPLRQKTLEEMLRKLSTKDEAAA